MDGDYLPTGDWPRLARHQEHDINLPVSTTKLEAGRETERDALIDRALDFGKGAMKLATNRGDTIFSTERACPGCGRSFPELDAMLFSYNSKHGWCEGCVGTGMALVGFDEEQTGEEGAWLANDDNELNTCRRCDGCRFAPST